MAELNLKQITDKLNTEFVGDNRKLVFWYDEKRELRAEYDALTLPGVEKIELGNNQFGVKHRVLRQEPEQRFQHVHAGLREARQRHREVSREHGGHAVTQSAELSSSATRRMPSGLPPMCTPPCWV